MAVTSWSAAAQGAGALVVNGTVEMTASLRARAALGTWWPIRPNLLMAMRAVTCVPSEDQV